VSLRRSGELVVGAFVLLALGAWLFSIKGLRVSGEWLGVDDSVVMRFAKAAGRPEGEGPLDWVHGDLLLFAFLCAGLLAGFMLGFFGRAIFYERQDNRGPEARDGSS
jgi:hypothetical protein